MIAPPVVPAVASLALRPVLDTGGPAEILGGSDAAVWMSAPEGVIVLAASDAVRLPNAVVVAAPAASRPFVARSQRTTLALTRDSYIMVFQLE